MKLALAAFGVAALVGAGYVIGKKIIENARKDEDFFDLDFDADDDDINVSAFTSESECEDSYGKKIKKASLFAVGAIKTSADKLGETIEDIKTKDMVKKGEQTVGAVKETGCNIKNDIKRDFEDLKATVASINDEEKEEKAAEGTGSDTAEEVKNDVKSFFKSDDGDDDNGDS